MKCNIDGCRDPPQTVRHDNSGARVHVCLTCAAEIDADRQANGHAPEEFINA